MLTFDTLRPLITIIVFMLGASSYSSTHGRKIQRDEAQKVSAPPTTANLAE